MGYHAAMRTVVLVVALTWGCGNEVVRVPSPPCDQPMLNGAVDSEEALSIATCLLEKPLPLLSLAGSGISSDGALPRWDVTLLGDGLVHSVGLAEGLRSGVAEYTLEEIFGSGGCLTTVPRPADSADVVPHALATLGAGDSALEYRIASDCLVGGTEGHLVVAKGNDRLLYSPDGKLIAPCLGCVADDPRACCAL
jgi:hypothetical protein